MDDVSLLENGFDYILNSLNNLKKFELGEESKYTIKYIIRDLISGIEIILKYRLQCDNWTFVVDNLDKISMDKYREGNFISVTLEQSIERLRNLCNWSIKKEDEEKLKSLKLIRNRIEHFKLILQEDETISLVYNSITVILNFIDADEKNFNNKFNKDEKKLYHEIKTKVLDLDEYLNERENDIKVKLPNVDLKTCPNCRKECLKVDGINCKCFLCNISYEDTNYERKKYIEANNPSYRDISKGAHPIEEVECPYCGDIMLIDYENDKVICFCCQTDLSIASVERCECCGQIGVIGVCDDCMSEISRMRYDDYREH